MNPWLEIPLDDYEAHMSLPSVAQAQFLADRIGTVTERLKPESVAIVGCSGGNGFDRISPELVKRVVGIDINPQYIAKTQERFQGRFDRLELLSMDVLDIDESLQPVDLVFAGLVFEYVDLRPGLTSIKRIVKPDGYLSTVLQLPSETVSAVSPSPYASLNTLESVLRFVRPGELERLAKSLGLQVRQSNRAKLSSGKEFHEFLFQNSKEEGERE